MRTRWFKSIVILLISSILVTFYSPSTVSSQATSPLSGVFYFYSETDFCSGTPCYSLFRFYPDGTVIGVTTVQAGDLTLEEQWPQLSSWFHIDNPENLSVGTYELRREHIVFSTVSATATVDYEGSYARDTLILNWYSHYNGNNGLRKYLRLEGVD